MTHEETQAQQQEPGTEVGCLDLVLITVVARLLQSVVLQPCVKRKYGVGKSNCNSTVISRLIIFRRYNSIIVNDAK